MVVRILAVIGLDLTKKSSGSVFSTFWSAESKGASLSSEDLGGSTVNAVAVGVSIVVSVATIEPRV